MTDKPDYEDLGGADAVLELIREHADDIEGVVIPITSQVAQLGAPGGAMRPFPGAGAWIKLCSGESIVIGKEAAELLINDGILNRLKIRCELDPLNGK